MESQYVVVVVVVTGIHTSTWELFDQAQGTMKFCNHITYVYERSIIFRKIFTMTCFGSMTSHLTVAFLLKQLLYIYSTCRNTC